MYILAPNTMFFIMHDCCTWATCFHGWNRGKHSSIHYIKDYYVDHYPPSMRHALRLDSVDTVSG